jgi:hypothetical protein
MSRSGLTRIIPVEEISLKERSEILLAYASLQKLCENMSRELGKEIYVMGTVFFFFSDLAFLCI